VSESPSASARDPEQASPSTDWLESLSPWPTDGFGLERITALLDRLGNPQRGFRSIHVVGTNGKSTTARTIARLLAAEGLRTASYLSPHVSGWHERLDTDPDGFERAIARIRADAEAVGATQFEAVTAAAFADFAARDIQVAAVEAGLGGRYDATNVVDAPVVVLTNVALDHTDALGETRELIAVEKLAVVRPGAIVVIGEPEWADLARAQGAARVDHPGRSALVLAGAAAEVFLARPLTVLPQTAEQLPGRLDRRSERPLEIHDGAHNLAGVGWLLPRLPDRTFTLVASILAGKDVDSMLRALAQRADTLVATQSSSSRAIPAAELAATARPYFARVESVADPVAARLRGLELAGPDGALLVAGSLYLLADLSRGG
jgi:dihydrofolate synthase / folylpolyglutamate synthase